MKSFPLPHIPVQDIFYLRQQWLYEFCMSDLKTGKSAFCSYCEGFSNNVCTMIPKSCFHFQMHVVAELFSNLNEVQYYIPTLGHLFLPNDRMFGTAKRSIQKNDSIYTPTEYENLIAEANKNFEIRSPKTEDNIDVKEYLPNHYKKLVLTVDS